MPAGGGLSYNHQKLTQTIGVFVEHLKIGDVFLAKDVVDYISTVPLQDYNKKGESAGGGVAPRQTKIEKSKSYLMRIIKSNAREWNLRFGYYYHGHIATPKNSKREIISAYGRMGGGLVYCKTDKSGNFFCIMCETKIKLKPQWAYTGPSGHYHIIRKEIQCNDCYHKFEVLRIDHEPASKQFAGAVSWKIKGEEE
mgnify:FL=1|jgi:hypothetical protein